MNKRRFTNFSNFDPDESNVEENEGDGTRQFESKSHATLYLIDARKCMFTETTDEGDSPFLLCLKCIRNAIRNQIFSMQSSYAGILLLGTREADNHLKLNNISIVQPLQKLAADHVLKVDEICIAIEDSTYEKTFGITDFNLADAFWLASKIFSEQTFKAFKTVVLFTNDDDPLKNQQSSHKRAVSSAADMAQNHIILDLIHLGKKFDSNKFYKEIIQVSRNDKNYHIADPVMKMNDMLDRISKISYRHVASIKIPFFISNDFTVGVAVHNLVKARKKPIMVTLSKSTNEQVKSKVQYFEEESGEAVSSENIVRSTVLGEERISFEQDEVKEMSNFGKRGLKLLGFKPASVIKMEHYIKPCNFLYPDDSEYEGSSLFFTTLLKRCLEKQVVVICTYYPRLTSAVRFVALLAQEEILEEGRQLTPPGFLVIHLPFANEVRNVDDKCTGKKRASDNQVQAAQNFIKKLKFNYKPDNFSNPLLRSHWSAVEALALDLPEPENVGDDTVPNIQKFPSAEPFKAAVYPNEYNPFLDFLPKRAVTKVEDVDANYVKILFKNGELNKLTVPKLKSYLTSVGVSATQGRKDDLVKKVHGYLMNLRKG